MNLSRRYTDLYNESIAEIADGNWQTDNLIDSSSDMRRGITLIIRPDDLVKAEIQKFLDELKAIDAGQYYYPDDDIHITVISVISCYNEFNLNNINVDSYIEVIRNSIADLKSFEVEFRGITASPSCIMVRGFPKDDTLNCIRENLRKNFRNSDLEQSLDKRYTLQTAHSTVVRFRKDLARKEAFLDKIKCYQDFNFGTFEVSSLEFVYNDWYQRKKFVKELYKFRLNK